MKQTVNGLNICRSKRRGQALVEFALLLIPRLLIVGGIVDFGLFFYFKNTAANAARAAVRQAVVTPNISSAALLKTNITTYLQDPQNNYLGYSLKSDPTISLCSAGLTDNCFHVEVHKTGYSHIFGKVTDMLTGQDPYGSATMRYEQSP